jgi:hypothetical protein
MDEKIFGEIGSKLRDYFEDIRTQKNDPINIHANYDSYCAAQAKADQIFQDPAELCRRTITALARCGDLSCDKSIVQYCQNVWSVKAVEVPNPSLNPVQRVRSHSHLHLQESASLERGDDSYHSHMINLDDKMKDNSDASMDKIYHKY